MIHRGNIDEHTGAHPDPQLIELRDGLLLDLVCDARGRPWLTFIDETRHAAFGY